MMFANADAGGSFTPMFGWASGPLGKTWHRLEQPTFRSFAPGDVLNLEIEGRWGGYISQIDQTTIMGPASADLVAANKLSIEAFDRVMDKLKPGVTMRELIAAGTISGMNGRATTGLGMHGRGTGDDGPLLVAARPEPDEVLDLRVDEGCSFVVKPSTILDGVADYCKWGDAVVVTAKGAERLGTRPKELIIQI
jgi:Xaa-Pro aminopeptidase